MEKLKLFYRACRYRFILDSREIRFLMAHLKLGDIAVDIGSHKGGYLYWMRKSVGLSGSCYAFEPQPFLYQYLLKIVSIYDWRNVHVEKIALSSFVGKTFLHVPGSGKSSPGASLEHLDSINNAVQVPTMTLDAFFDAKDKVPDLIKIDVEGHEIEVLKGGINLLGKYKPLLIIECEDRHNGGRTNEVFSFLIDLGYRGFFFHKGIKTDLSDFDPIVHQSKIGRRYWAKKHYVNNFIFFSFL